MELETYITKTLKNLPEGIKEVTFNLGITSTSNGVEVYMDSPNRIEFSVEVSKGVRR